MLHIRSLLIYQCQGLSNHFPFKVWRWPIPIPPEPAVGTPCLSFWMILSYIFPIPFLTNHSHLQIDLFLNQGNTFLDFDHTVYLLSICNLCCICLSAKLALSSILLTIYWNPLSSFFLYFSHWTALLPQHRCLSCAQIPTNTCVYRLKTHLWVGRMVSKRTGKHKHNRAFDISMLVVWSTGYAAEWTPNCCLSSNESWSDCAILTWVEHILHKVSKSTLSWD